MKLLIGYVIVVDKIIDQNQVVLKSIDSSMEKIDGVAGAAILGDGRVALVLDVNGLLDAA